MKRTIRQLGLTLASTLCLLATAIAQQAPVSLVFAGDIVLDDTAGAMIEKGQDPFAAFAKLFNKADIRLVILDLTMPHMDGAETCAALRARGYQTPILLSSGFNETEAVTRFSRDGLAGFLQKPYRVSTFIQAVRDALEVR